MTKFVIMHSISMDAKAQALPTEAPKAETSPVVSIMYDDIFKIEEIKIGKFNATRLHTRLAGTILVVETPAEVVKIINEASK